MGQISSTSLKKIKTSSREPWKDSKQGSSMIRSVFQEIVIDAV